MITLTPLSGPWRPNDDGNGGEEEQAAAYAYLVELDDARILLGCGGNESFSFARPVTTPSDPRARAKGAAHQLIRSEQEVKTASKRPLDEVLLELGPTIDLVLLSHSTLSHLGTLAWARAHAGLTAPVFSTMATQAMGRMTTLAAVRAIRTERQVDQEMRIADELDIERSVIGAVAAKEEGPAHWPQLDADAEEAWLHSQALSAITSARDPDGVHLAELRTRVTNSGERLRVPTEQQVEETFDHINALRYLQPHRFSSGPLAGTTLTAYNAGHSLGGALWKLRSPDQGTFLFALDWNHNRERHLDGAALMPQAGDASKGAELRRADVLVTSIGRGSVINLKRKERDSALLAWVSQAVGRDGSVILPVDASARTIELLVLLDQHWSATYDSGRYGPPTSRPHLCFISPSAAEMLERARTLMEWTTREWASFDRPEDGTKPKSKAQLQKDAVSSPLDFKNVRVYASVAAMQEELPPGLPKVVLAVHQSGWHGPAIELISRFAQARDPRDLVLLTSRAEPGSPLRTLWQVWQSRQSPDAQWGKGQLGAPIDLGHDPNLASAQPNDAAPPPLGVPVPTSEFTLRVNLYSRIKLQGDEFNAYEEALAATRAKAAQRRSLVARSRRRMQAEKQEEEASDSDASGSGLDSDDDPDEDLDNAASGLIPHSGQRKRRASQAFGAKESIRDLVSDIYLRGDAAKIHSFWSGGRNAHTGVRYRMVPTVEKRRRLDAYGELIDPSHWTKRAEELSGTTSDPRELARIERQRQREEEERARSLAKQRAKKFAPAKFGVAYDTDLKLVCSVGYVDNAGLGDGKALAYLLPQLQPRRLVLVGGAAQDRVGVKETLLAIKGMTRNIWAPALGEQTKIATSTDDGTTRSVTVNLQNRLLGHLRWSHFEEWELARLTARWMGARNADNGLPSLAWIDDPVESEPAEDGKIIEVQEQDEPMADAPQAAESSAAAAEQDKQATTSPAPEQAQDVKKDSDQYMTEALPSSDDARAPKKEQEQPAPAEEEASIPVRVGPSRVPSTMMIGDLRLSALKARLARSRIPADFAGDGLLVAGWRTNRSITNSTARAEAVTIRKAGGDAGDGSPQIVVEGNVGQDLVSVRDVVYGMHAQIGQ